MRGSGHHVRLPRQTRLLGRFPLFKLAPVVLLLGSGGLPCYWVAGSSGIAAQASHAAHPAAAQTVPALEVHVALAEWSLTPLQVDVPVGQPVRLLATNAGVLAHALAVEGEGLYAESDAAGSGQTVALDITFATPGTYDLYCPVGAGQHRALGQEAILVAASAPAGDVPAPSVGAEEAAPADDAGEAAPPGGTAGAGDREPELPPPPEASPAPADQAA